MEIDLAAGEPDAFSQDERRRLRELVELGDEVDTVVLEQNVENARALVFAGSGGRLLGVAALKRPNAAYRQNIGEKSGFILDPDVYPFELGYVFVQEEFRGNGISHRLVTTALEQTDGRGLFATARVDNVGILRALGRAGFSQVGADYPGRKPETSIRVLVRNEEPGYSAGP